MTLLYRSIILKIINNECHWFCKWSTDDP